MPFRNIDDIFHILDWMHLYFYKLPVKINVLLSNHQIIFFHWFQTLIWPNYDGVAGQFLVWKILPPLYSCLEVPEWFNF